MSDPQGVESRGLEEQTGRSNDGCCLSNRGRCQYYSNRVRVRLTDSALDIDAVHPHCCLPQRCRLPALKHECSLPLQDGDEKQPHFAHLLNSLLKSAVKAQMNLISHSCSMLVRLLQSTRQFTPRNTVTSLVYPPRHSRSGCPEDQNTTAESFSSWALWSLKQALISAARIP